MNSSVQLVVFRLDDLRCALSLAAVERVVQAVEVTPLPRAPATVQGVISVQGRVVPVFNTRRRFGLPERELRPEDQMVLARAAARTVALTVDTVDGLFECDASSVVPAGQIWPDTGAVAGIVRRPDGLILIEDLEAFLTADERREMELALAAEPCAP